MPEVSDTQGILRQNLIDAGCEPGLVQQCMDLAREKKTAEFKRLLACHRQMLLNTIHTGQRQIDCLDYLFFQLEKQNF